MFRLDDHKPVGEKGRDLKFTVSESVAQLHPREAGSAQVLTQVAFSPQTSMHNLSARFIKSGTRTPQNMDHECGCVEEDVQVPVTSTRKKQPGTQPANSAFVSACRMEEEGSTQTPNSACAG